MKKAYGVLWTEAAEKDLIDVIDRIARDSPSSAVDIFKRIKQKSSTLRTFPQRGRIVPELRDQGINLYRELIVPPWRIVYNIWGETVYVLSFFDARQNIEDVLLEKLIR